MNFFKKIFLYAVVVTILLVVCVTAYITLALPNVGGAENITIELTPKRLARGEYLASHVALCMDCHSQRDWSKPISVITADKLGAGGDDFDASLGVPGDIYAPNITPYKLKSWTDGEIFRALTTGQRKDGSAIYPLMPWPHFAKMDREDLYSVIAYLRTIKAIKTDAYPKPKLNFPANILVHTMPVKAMLGKLPAIADTVKYGRYLVLAADCSFCHSHKKDEDIIPGNDFAGGNEFKIGDKSIFSANLTPDKQSGMGNWTSKSFVALFKSHTDSVKATQKTAAPQVTVMPWYDYSGMTETDLKAIFAYLKTLQPVRNKVASNE